MAKLSLHNVFYNFYIRVFTWRRGILVGSDELGNQYYRAIKPGPWGREPRWKDAWPGCKPRVLRNLILRQSGSLHPAIMFIPSTSVVLNLHEYQGFD